MIILGLIALLFWLVCYYIPSQISIRDMKLLVTEHQKDTLYLILETKKNPLDKILEYLCFKQSLYFDAKIMPAGLSSPRHYIAPNHKINRYSNKDLIRCSFNYAEIIDFLIKHNGKIELQLTLHIVFEFPKIKSDCRITSLGVIKITHSLA